MIYYSMSGSFGIIRNKNSFAIKIPKNKTSCFSHEFNILKKIQHENIVKVFEMYPNGCFEMEGLFRPNWIELSYVIGNLDLLAPRLPLLIEAIEHLHAMNIVHRDIKPENIMIRLDKVDLKLVDFGFACEDPTCRFIGGTLYYSSPLILNKILKYDYRTMKIKQLKEAINC